MGQKRETEKADIKEERSKGSNYVREKEILAVQSNNFLE
jgi:hypothetical protein